MLYKKIIRKARTVSRKTQFQLAIRQQLYSKWQSDCTASPLSERHFPLFHAIHQAYWINQKRFPGIVSGESFNDKIQWLKLFGQDTRMVGLTDKLALKQIVNQTLGPGFVAATLSQGSAYQDIDLAKLPRKFVLKANHDSGSVYFVHDKNDISARRLKSRLDRAIAITYGKNGGEWQYWPIPKQVFAEEMLPFENGAPPPDFKLHCSDGQVLWLQYIYDRGRNTKEVITDRDGKVMGLNFDHHMTSVFHFERPYNWPAILDVAETMSRGFQYVRVDLYNLPDRIVVGEMTFTPLNGMYQSEGNIELGKLIPLDRTKVRELVCTEFPGPERLWPW